MGVPRSFVSAINLVEWTKCSLECVYQFKSVKSSKIYKVDNKKLRCVCVRERDALIIDPLIMNSDVKPKMKRRSDQSNSY